MNVMTSHLSSRRTPSACTTPPGFRPNREETAHAHIVSNLKRPQGPIGLTDATGAVGAPGTAGPAGKDRAPGRDGRDGAMGAVSDAERQAIEGYLQTKWGCCKV